MKCHACWKNIRDSLNYIAEHRIIEQYMFSHHLFSREIWNSMSFRKRKDKKKKRKKELPIRSDLLQCLQLRKYPGRCTNQFIDISQLCCDA
jgi:hypothetical protein